MQEFTAHVTLYSSPKLYKVLTLSNELPLDAGKLPMNSRKQVSNEVLTPQYNTLCVMIQDFPREDKCRYENRTET